MDSKNPNNLTQNEIQEIIGITADRHGERRNAEKNSIPEILYKKSDQGPFTVFVEADNIGRNKHLKIAKEIFNLKLNNVHFKIKGRNRLGVDFSTYEAANEFINCERLKEKGFKIFIPLNFVTCKGVIRNVDISFDLEEILQTCSSPCKILNIKRFNRRVIKDKKVEFVETSTLLITFEGRNLPQEIKIYGLPTRISTYIPPVTQCYSCFRYGHTKKLCKSKPKCKICGEEHKEEQICLTKCLHCGSEEHTSTSRKCLEYDRQKNIKRIMAYENISFFEANLRLPKQNEINFTLDYRQFPPLRNKNLATFQKNTTDHTQNNSRKRSLDESSTPVASPISKKKNNNQSVQGYDRSLHNSQLLFPNSRPPRDGVAQGSGGCPGDASHLSEGESEGSSTLIQSPNSSIQCAEPMETSNNDNSQSSESKKCVLNREIVTINENSNLISETKKVSEKDSTPSEH